MEVSDFGGTRMMTKAVEDQLQAELPMGAGRPPAFVYVVEDEPDGKVWVLYPGDKSLTTNDLTSTSGPYGPTVATRENQLINCIYPDGYLAICGVSGGVPWWR